MKMGTDTSVEALAMEAATAAHAAANYVLHLYVAGLSPRSIRAISNIRRFCEERLKGRHDLNIVDISQHPELAKDEQIFAAPTLIKEFPLPVCRFVGDMSHFERILLGLDLRDATG